MIRVQFEADFASWRKQARKYLDLGTPPQDLEWSDSNSQQASFLLETELPPWRPSSPANPATVFKIDKGFLKTAELASLARDEDRWALLYRAFYRLRFENPNLHKVSVDEDIRQIELLAKAIRRDLHKMHAFVRFRKIEIENTECYVAWYKPDHHILKEGAEFFARRFGDKNWTIATPEMTAHYREGKLSFAAGISESPFNEDDPWEDAWKDYYSSIYNPGRLNLRAMQSSMPQKFWAQMPEASLIQELIRKNPEHLQKMARAQFIQADVPEGLSLPEVKKASLSCTACPLHAESTQTVFGEGPLKASLMIVGEQPGDHEDLQGRPFVGPAGQVLTDALTAIGLQRSDLYLTNAVKHFKYEQNEKARIHKKASGSEMHACRPWLEREITLVQPRVVLLLGVTAGTSVLGRLPKIGEERGRLQKDSRGFWTMLSWHPSAILRASSAEEKQQRFDELCRDLFSIKELLAKSENEAHK